MILSPDHGQVPGPGQRWSPRTQAGELGGWTATHESGEPSVDCVLAFPITAPVGSMLNEIVAYIKPGGDHVDLPEVVPRWELRADGTPIEACRDSSETIAEYEALHGLRKAVAVLIEPGVRYEVVFFCEAGASSRAGLSLCGVAAEHEKVVARA